MHKLFTSDPCVFSEDFSESNGKTLKNDVRDYDR